MKRFALLLSLVATLAVAVPAVANEKYHEPSVKADNKAAFAEIAADVRKEMDGGGRYEYLKPAERTQVDQGLDQMTALFDKYGDVSAMTEQAKIELFNAQEKVNSTLTLRDRDRVICKKEAPVGSHIPIVQCHTYGQAEDAKRGTEKQMTDWRRAQCVGACGGGN
jgi:hypothetical protein